jgi:hypothetical protein
MKREEYWNKKIKYPVAEDVDLELCLKKKKGKLERFSLIFRYKIGGKWKMIKRCDNTGMHGGIPHCHIYKLEGEERKEIVGDANDNMGVIADILIKDLKKNYKNVVENYNHSK